MQIYSEIAPLRAKLAERRTHKERIGLVPTMGALHEGHRSLVTRSLRDNDHTVCSIYVNPTQFNNPDDLTHYPRTLEQDIALLEKLGCNTLFCPNDRIMYPAGQSAHLSIDFGSLDKVLEGRYRPGHFSGVGVVVSKLFHIVQPDRAYFGQKDLQQFAIIQKLVQDLLFPIQLVRVPIVRTTEGLALSSRNRRLSAAQQQLALRLHHSLQRVKVALEDGTPVAEARQSAINYLTKEPEIRLDYLEVVDATTFGTVSDIAYSQQVALCIAAYVGEIRLIDNVLIDL